MAKRLKQRKTYTPEKFDEFKVVFDRKMEPKINKAVRDALLDADTDAESIRGPVSGRKWEGLSILRDDTPRAENPLDEVLQARISELGSKFPNVASLFRECMIYANRQLKCPALGLFGLQLVLFVTCFASPTLLSGPMTQGTPGWCYGIAWVGAAFILRLIAVLMVCGCGFFNFPVAVLYNCTNLFCCVTSLFLLGNLGDDDDFSTDDYICIGVAVAGSLGTIHNWMSESVVIENRTVRVEAVSVWIFSTNTTGLTTTSTTTTAWKCVIGVPFYLEDGCRDKAGCNATIPCRYCGRHIEAIVGATQKLYCPSNNCETLPRPRPWKLRVDTGCWGVREHECGKCGEIARETEKRVRHRFNCEKYTPSHQSWREKHLICRLQKVGRDTWQQFQRPSAQQQPFVPAPSNAMHEPILGPQTTKSTKASTGAITYGTTSSHGSSLDGHDF